MRLVMGRGEMRWPLSGVGVVFGFGAVLFALSCGARAEAGGKSDELPLPPRQGVPTFPRGNDVTVVPPPVPPGAPMQVPTDPCQDNPLILDCNEPMPEPAQPTPDDCYTNPLILCPEPDSPRELAEAKANSVLQLQCYSCHAPVFTPVGSSGQLWESLDKLREIGWVTPCAAESSPVVRSMRSGEMPPESSGRPPVSRRDIALVVSAIDFGCTDTQKLCAADASIEGCAVVQVESMLEQNCGECHGRQALDAGMLDDFNYIDNMTTLISAKKVLPCRSTESPLVRRALDGSMPPPADRMTRGRALDGADMGLLIDFIDGLCPGPATSGPVDMERVAVESILSTSCGECHGSRALELGQVQGGLANIEDVDALIRANQLIPCVAEQSLLIQSLRLGTMPPAGAPVPAPTLAEIDRISAFIDRPCAGP